MISLLLTASVEAFLAEDHVGVLATIRPDGTPHAVPVRFTWDSASGLARVMSVGSRAKARNILASPERRVAICQVAGFRWVTLEGAARVSSDPSDVREGVRQYTRRFHAAPPNPQDLTVIEIEVDGVMSLNA